MTHPVAVSDELSYSLRRQYIDEYLARELAALVSSQLLDLGGVKREQRGRTDASTYIEQVTAVNISREKGADAQADAAALPFADESYAAVLCSEVLEHVRNPLEVLKQIERVLKPSGVLLVTVPFLFRQHGDPSDYGRYTEWYWAETLRKLGFDRISIEKQGMFASVLADMLRHWAQQNQLAGGRLYRLRCWLLPRVVGWVRRRALTADSAKATEGTWGSAYVGGFGIRAVKAKPA
jgi:SAM-dependent methyltransferase